MKQIFYGLYGIFHVLNWIRVSTLVILVQWLYLHSTIRCGLFIFPFNGGSRVCGVTGCGCDLGFLFIDHL